MRNKKFIIIAMFIGLGLIINSILVYKENIKNKESYAIYNNAKKIVESGENYEKALTELDKLPKGYLDSYLINLDKALIFSNLNQSEKSEEQLALALEKNPKLRKDTDFLYAYTEILVANKEYKLGEEKLKSLEKIGVPEKYKEGVKVIKDKIDKENK